MNLLIDSIKLIIDLIVSMVYWIIGIAIFVVIMKVIADTINHYFKPKKL